MASTFEEVRAALATHNGTMTGVTRAYARPPEKLNDFPCVLHLPAEGEFTYDAFNGACFTKVHRLRVVVVAGVRSDLPEDDETLVPFIDRMPDHLRDNPTLGLSDLAVPAHVANYQLVNFVYAGVTHLGLEFWVEIGVFDDE